MTVTFAHHKGKEARVVLPDVIALYHQVYAVPPYSGDPFFAPETAAHRIAATFDMEGFALVTAWEGGEVLGSVHGVRFTTGAPWWHNLDRRPRPELVGAADQGDVWWLRELMVRVGQRGRGIARQMHDRVVGRRRESWTVLTCITDNEPAHSIYQRWGYAVVGRTRHGPGSPLYDAMTRRAFRRSAGAPGRA